MMKKEKKEIGACFVAVHDAIGVGACGVGIIDWH
jgi:hypothetical protein